MELINKIKFGFIALYFILILVIERFYYDKLFNKSLEIIPHFQETNKKYDLLWRFITFFGTKPGIGPIYCILFFFIPLNKVFTLTFLLLFTGYVDHTLKVVYRQERPIWMNDEIDIGVQHACGYGNPSGHSLSSTCLYLSLWYTLREINKDFISNKFLCKILNFLNLLIIITTFGLIMSSRLYLGVHSLNQIIFGCTLGFGLFLLFLPILKIHYTEDEFLDKQYSYRYFHFIFIIICTIFFYFIYFLRDDIPGVQEKENWKKMCYDQKWSKLLIKGSFFGGMAIFIICGMIFGLLYSKKHIDKEFNSKDEILIKWQKGTFKSRLMRLFLLLLGSIPVGIIFLLNKILKNSEVFFYVLTPILFFIGGFLSFGPCFIYGFKLSLKIFGKSEIISLPDEEKDNFNNNNYIQCSN